MSVQAVEGVVIDAKREFLLFLKTFRDRQGVLKYRERIKEMVSLKKTSVTVDLNDLYMYNPKLVSLLVRNPEPVLEAASEALREIVRQEDPVFADAVDRFFVRVKHMQTVKLRELRSEYVGRLVMVEGILVRATPVKEKLIKSVLRHVGEEGEHEFTWPPEGEMHDEFELPAECPVCGGRPPFRLVPEKSVYADWQKVVIQEKPEEVPPGQLPRSIEVILTRDLVDLARPGDRVSVTGVLKVRPVGSLKRGTGKPPIFDMYIDAVHIDVSQKLLEEVMITKEDEEKIKNLAKDPWIRKRIIASIAPGIHGHWDIKEAIALALFGGVPKQLEDGTRIRGDIHVLIIGDPGTAKSQLLQFAARVAPRGIYTSGKGSSAAGLTAAVLRDKTTGEYYLEAGALVLADGGLAAIDEIDKMRSEDRSAIHEALEQQSVSIAKAGIVARLNARTTVIAAGNPKYGRWLGTNIAENIELPPTILSRFDLIFILRDEPHPELDRKLARHVLRVHREAEYMRPEIPVELLKKYVSYARRNVHPRMTERAAEIIEKFFVELRKQGLVEGRGGRMVVVPITARQLEALVRLAEAHARMALKPEVTEEDALEAIRLMMVMMQGVGYDTETGMIDSDIISVGMPRSRQEKLYRLSELIRTMVEESGEDCVKLADLKERAETLGIKADELQRLLKMLRGKGEIYERRFECYAPV